MTAKKILDFIEENSCAPNMFDELERSIENEKLEILVALEKDFKNKELTRKYNDACEKLRAIHLMRNQRLELFRQAQERGGI